LFLNAKNLSKVLGLSESSVYELMHEKDFPSLCIGSRFVVPKEHFKEMMILAGMIKAAGGEYVLMASRADVFATFEVTDEEGNKRRCSRGEYVQAQVETGKEIEIISLEDLLSLLGTSFEALEASREIDVEYLLDDKYSKK
jgi:hypothetical protein